MTCYYPLDAYRQIGTGGIVFERSSFADKPLQLACGQCCGCRIDKSKEWAARCVHEAQMHPENCFVTLTYDETNVPKDGSLNKSHFQLFMKRLRKHFEGTKIRYFHCGEYGEKLQRPHYHACLFGIDFHDRIPYSSDNDIVTDQSPTLEKIWGKGFCTVGELNYQTAAYTARYIMKKITGEKARDHYTRVNLQTGELTQLQPEYVTMSLGRKRGEGLGGSFYEKYKSDFFPADECPIPGKGVYKSVPKYYDGLLKEADPDTYAKVIERREKYRLNTAHDHTKQRLEAKHTVKQAQLSKLPRS